MNCDMSVRIYKRNCKNVATNQQKGLTVNNNSYFSLTTHIIYEGIQAFDNLLWKYVSFMHYAVMN